MEYVRQEEEKRKTNQTKEVKGKRMEDKKRIKKWSR